MTASATPSKNDPKSLFDVVELTETTTTYYTAPAERGVRLTLLRLTNVGSFTGLVDVYLVQSGGSAGETTKIISGYPVPCSGYPLLIPLGGEILEASATLQAACRAAKADPATNEFSATEVAGGGTVTYAATTVTDTSLNRTASANNADDVGKRIYVSGGTWAIITSNTGGAGTSVLTASAGWRELVGGLERAAATPAANTAYKISASLRDVGETTLLANSYKRGLATCNGKTGRVVGNNAGIATYGTTFQIEEGGWSGGTNPGNAAKWDIAPSILIAASGIEMAS